MKPARARSGVASFNAAIYLVQRTPARSIRRRHALSSGGVGFAEQVRHACRSVACRAQPTCRLTVRSHACRALLSCPRPRHFPIAGATGFDGLEAMVCTGEAAPLQAGVQVMCSDTDEERHVALHVHGALCAHEGCALPVTTNTAKVPKKPLSNGAGFVALKRIVKATPRRASRVSGAA